MQRPVLSTCLIPITILLITFYLFSSSLTPRITFLQTIKSPQQPLLRLNTHNEFHISIFSDLHYGEEENGWGIDQDIKSTRVMNTILDHESPDLVVISTHSHHFRMGVPTLTTYRWRFDHGREYLSSQLY